MSELRTRPKPLSREVDPPVQPPEPKRALAVKETIPSTAAHALERSSIDPYRGLESEPRFEVMLDPELGSISERPEDLSQKLFSLLDSHGVEESQLILARVRDRAAQLRSLAQSNPEATFAIASLRRADAWERIVDVLEPMLAPALSARLDLDEIVTPLLLRSIETRLAASEKSAQSEIAERGPQSTHAVHVLSKIHELREDLKDDPRQAWMLEGAVSELLIGLDRDPLTAVLLRDIPRSVARDEHAKDRIIETIQVAADVFSFGVPVSLASHLVLGAPTVVSIKDMSDEWSFRAAGAGVDFEPGKRPLTQQTASGWELLLSAVSFAIPVMAMRGASVLRASRTIRLAEDAAQVAEPLAKGSSTSLASELPDWTKALKLDGKHLLHLNEAQHVPEFLALATTHPKAAASIIHFWAQNPAMGREFPLEPTLKAFAAEGPRALERLGALLGPPRTTSTMTRSGYEVARRLKTLKDKLTPAIHIRPSPKLDHNGVFHVSGFQEDAQGALKWARTDVPTLGNVHPEQVIVNGKPLDSLAEVAVFSAHGSRSGFQQLTNREAAELIAESIKRARSDGQTVTAVLLDSCHQRDARWFVGESNAQDLAKYLDELLETPVQVLAANRPGALYGTRVSSRTFRAPRGDQDLVPVHFESAQSGPKFHMTPDEIVASVTALAAGVTLSSAVVYSTVVIRQHRAHKR